MKKLWLLLMLALASSVHAECSTFDKYNLDDVVDEKEFFIAGVQFEAQSFCPDYILGDQVIFLDGEPNGNCTQGTLLNLRNNISCDIWCPYPI